MGVTSAAWFDLGCAICSSKECGSVLSFETRPVRVVHAAWSMVGLRAEPSRSQSRTDHVWVSTSFLSRIGAWRRRTASTWTAGALGTVDRPCLCTGGRLGPLTCAAGGVRLPAEQRLRVAAPHLSHGDCVTSELHNRRVHCARLGLRLRHGCLSRCAHQLRCGRATAIIRRQRQRPLVSPGVPRSCRRCRSRVGPSNVAYRQIKNHVTRPFHAKSHHT